MPVLRPITDASFNTDEIDELAMVSRVILWS
jgi:hypothetical protein